MLNPTFQSLLLSACLAAVTPAAAQQAESLTKEWYLMQSDSLYGINLPATNVFLRGGEFSSTKNHTSEPVLVAVIDGGFDFTHPQLADRVWTNARDIADNGIDDDRNGYIDDIHGWNFLGNASGESFTKAGTEPFREYKRLRTYYKDIDTCRLSKRQRLEHAYYLRMEREAGIRSYQMFTQYMARIDKAYKVCDSLMKVCYGDRPTTIEDFIRIEVADTTGYSEDLSIVASRPAIFKHTAAWSEVVKDQHNEYTLALKRIASLDNNDDDPHIRLGNNPSDFRHLYYGNNDIAQDTYHGTMVSGIIAACTEAPTLRDAVKIMGIRAIPDGDEYDRDVAAAIRYAVDNGAKVINMSFGKYVSPNQEQVDKAIRYAQRHDVLLIAAAGNNSRNVDQNPSYPLCYNAKGQRHSNLIIVGSTDKHGRVGEFSNYGAHHVDLFAPGVDIRSTAPEGKYDTALGTSISAPMVSGTAAMIRSMCPKLSAAQIRNILLETVRDASDIETAIPNRRSASATAHTGDLCLSHGILDARAALSKALETNKIRK